MRYVIYLFLHGAYGWHMPGYGVYGKGEEIYSIRTEQNNVCGVNKIYTVAKIIWFIVPTTASAHHMHVGDSSSPPVPCHSSDSSSTTPTLVRFAWGHLTQQGGLHTSTKRSHGEAGEGGYLPPANPPRRHQTVFALAGLPLEDLNDDMKKTVFISGK